MASRLGLTFLLLACTLVVSHGDETMLVQRGLSADPDQVPVKAEGDAAAKLSAQEKEVEKAVEEVDAAAKQAEQAARTAEEAERVLAAEKEAAEKAVEAEEATKEAEETKKAKETLEKAVEADEATKLARTSEATKAEQKIKKMVEDKTVPAEEPAAAADGSNNSSFFNATLAPTPAPIYMYRLIFTKTHGASYVCNAEIKFFNELLEEINATFRQQSSCYACATVCEQKGSYCAQPYGNPLAAFDGFAPKNDSASDEAVWSCTAQGGMPGGKGSEVIEFQLPKRPARYEIHRPLISDSTPMAWVLQEKEQWPSDRWFEINAVDDAPQSLMYGVDVLQEGRYEALVFPAVCPDERMDLISDVDSEPLRFDYVPQGSRFLTNNGYTVQIDGNFGTLKVGNKKDAVKYDAKQLRFHLPAERTIDEETYLSPGRPVGEMHILHESQFELGRRQHLLVITIQLKLPLEGSDATEEELFFRNMGLEDLPDIKDSDYMIPGGVEIGTTFGPSLRGSYATLNCDDDDLTWLVMSRPAHCSARVVESFRQAFGPTLPSPSDAVMDHEAFDKLAARAEADALAAQPGGKSKAAPPVPLHAGRARDLPVHARTVALTTGEYMASLKGGVTLEPEANSTAP